MHHPVDVARNTFDHQQAGKGEFNSFDFRGKLKVTCCEFVLKQAVVKRTKV